MEKIKNIVANTYKIVVYMVAIVLFVAILFFNIISQHNSGIAITITVMLLLSVFIFLINKFIINKIKKKTNNIMTIILITIFLILEILSVKYFMVEYNWDFKYVMETAKQLYETNTTENLYYYKMYPNNIVTTAIAYVGMLIFRGEIGAYIINILFIFGAAIFTVLSAKKIGGDKMGLNTALILVMFSPLYLYSPIVYSDTLSIIFPVMTLYFWLITKESIKNSNKKKAYIFVTLMSIASFIGFLIKAPSAIILIAICIDSIFTFKKQFKYIVAILVIFMILNFIYNSLCTNFIIKDEKKNSAVIPYTHWVMMGLNKPEEYGGTSIGWGAYSQSDVDATNESGDYENKVNYNIQTIKDRLMNYGLYGYLSFLKHKFIYVWTDSTFYVLNKIGWDTKNKESLPYDIVLNNEKNKPFLTYLDSFYLLIITIIFIGLIIDIKDKKQEETRILAMSIIGIAIFLLIWEARSRYVYNFLPILCLLYVIGIQNMQEFIEKIKEKRKGK